MVLVPVGESAVSISINGTERVNELISDDTNYDLTESFNTEVYVNGSRRVNNTQTGDETYNISENHNVTIDHNGSREVDDWVSSDTNYDVNTSITQSESYSHTENGPGIWEISFGGWCDEVKVTLTTNANGGASGQVGVKMIYSDSDSYSHSVEDGGTKYPNQGTTWVFNSGPYNPGNGSIKFQDYDWVSGDEWKAEFIRYETDVSVTIS